MIGARELYLNWINSKITHFITFDLTILHFSLQDSLFYMWLSEKSSYNDWVICRIRREVHCNAEKEGCGHNFVFITEKCWDAIGIFLAWRQKESSRNVFSGLPNNMRGARAAVASGWCLRNYKLTLGGLKCIYCNYWLLTDWLDYQPDEFRSFNNWNIPWHCVIPAPV